MSIESTEFTRAGPRAIDSQFWSSIWAKFEKPYKPDIISLKRLCHAVLSSEENSPCNRNHDGTKKTQSLTWNSNETGDIAFISLSELDHFNMISKLKFSSQKYHYIS